MSYYPDHDPFIGAVGRALDMRISFEPDAEHAYHVIRDLDAAFDSAFRALDGLPAATAELAAIEVAYLGGEMTDIAASQAIDELCEEYGR